MATASSTAAPKVMASPPGAAAPLPEKKITMAQHQREHEQRRHGDFVDPAEIRDAHRQSTAQSARR